ncbi:hypothetical protein [Candidatus Villigracilis affinis]|uniref:hypothetical protein n=1 Tax=Candidatus Villigracilis affinis TaxID=3140682 RepID=UPI001D5DF20E|nr:hypothetical protein [Anaerolineales bacterium]
MANAVETVSRPGLRKTATKALVKAANLLTRVLPEETVSNLMNKASSLLGGGGGLPRAWRRWWLDRLSAESR